MPLSAAELSKRLWDGRSDIDPSRTLAVVPTLNTKALSKSNAASLDLRLGRWFRVLHQSKLTNIPIDDAKTPSTELVSKEYYIRFNGHFILHPGQFVMGITLEWLRFPFDLSGYVTGKSALGRRGLIIETAAGIHPGFTGCLTLELANVGVVPIQLKPGMQICQVFFHQVANNTGAASTQFIGHRKPTLGYTRKDEVVTALERPYFKRVRPIKN